MKKYPDFILICCAILLVGTFGACDKLLEKPIGNDITEETIFSTEQNALTYLAETYRQIIPFGFPYFGSNSTYRMDRSILAAACDEANFVIGWSPTTEQNTAGFTANNARLTIDMFRQNYVGIRYAWKFIENIDHVSELSQDEKERMKAECKALIALRYSHMLKNYGGVSLVNKSLSVDDEIKIPRSSIEETVNYILQLCDEALAVLPNTYESQWKGRVTAGVPLAVKAETLLFAASPLFNSATTYLPSSVTTLLSYGNYDINRWKAAADAAKAVIDWAESNGYRIINTGNPFQDFGIATSQMDNPEIIFAYKGTNTGQNGFTRYYLPTLGAFNEGNNLTYNFLPFFHKMNGADQDWPSPNEPERDFSEYETKMEEMEPRFKSSFWKYGSYAWNNPSNNRFMWNYEANIQDLNYSAVAKLAKFTYDYQGGTDANFNPDWTVFRLAEFFLDYAEALNEFEANHAAAYDALNVIRKRGGLPEIQPEDPRFNTQESFRELVRRERAIELYAEEHRPYDVRRWKIADQPGVYGGPFYTFQYTKNTANNAYLTYRVQHFEDRYWNDKMYLCPFPESEVNKGYLIQNPGY